MKSFLLCCFSSLFLPSSGVALVAPFLSDGAVSSGLLKSFQLQLADGSHSLGKVGNFVNLDTGGSLLLILNKSLKYLGSIVEDARFSLGDGFLLVSGEKHQFAKIVSEALFVEVKLLLRFIFSSVVDANADRLSELNSKTSGLDFGESESSSESGSVVVPDGLASDGRSKFIKRSGSNGGSSSSSCL